MAVGYRAILRLAPSEDAVDVAEGQVRDWLRDKLGAKASSIAWDQPGHYRLGRRAELLVVHAEHEVSGRRRLYRLIERNDAGRWVVSLYATSLISSREHPQTIVVEVDLIGVDREAALATAAPPRVVRSILDTVSASDGAVPLTGTPAFVRAGQTSEVVKAVADPDRMASVVVGVSPARDLDDDWRQVLSSLTTHSVGVTVAYVVVADAAEEFNLALTSSHQVRRGEIRTYLPRVDLSDSNDAFRHKWLTLPTLTQSLNGTKVAEPMQRRHGEAARRRFVEAELPADVRRTVDVLRRAETSVERAAKVEAKVAAAQPKKARSLRLPESTLAALRSEEVSAPLAASSTLWMERVAQSIRRWLGVEKPELDQMEALDEFIDAKVAEIKVFDEQLTDAWGREDGLQKDLDDLRRERDEMELELALVQEEQIKSLREATTLRQRLAAGKKPQDAYVAPDEEIWNPPSSVEELVERLQLGAGTHIISERVVFTGDLDRVLEVDRRDATGRYASAFWQQVRTLHDYAEARSKGFNGGVHGYLTDDRVDGTKCPPKQHASKESETVLNNTKWRHERVFPVPIEADPSGEVLMEAHFKPTWSDTFAPRMYYFDDVAQSGKVYIGYIGKHLTNTQT